MGTFIRQNIHGNVRLWVMCCEFPHRLLDASNVINVTLAAGESYIAGKNEAGTTFDLIKAIRPLPDKLESRIPYVFIAMLMHI